MESRFTTILGITFPVNYKDPNLQADTQAAPDATATGDGLSIQGTNARLYSGVQDPNGRIKAAMGSIFLRVGIDVDYNAYLKEDDDGGNTGWFPIVTLGGKASSSGGKFTFGLTDDTVGANAAVRYGNVLHDCYPTGGAVSYVVLPTTQDTILDIKSSSDGGNTWHSIFPPGNDETGDVAYMLNKIIIPVPADPNVFNTKQKLFSTFNNVKIPKNSLLRIDSLQSGGTSGINVDIEMGPIPPNALNSVLGSAPGQVWVAM